MSNRLLDAKRKLAERMPHPAGATWLREVLMKRVTIYAGRSGSWIYEVWIATRAVVVGCCATREAAEQQASRV